LRLFEFTHKGGVSENVGNHPNGYFTSSFDYTKVIEKKKNSVSGESKSNATVSGGGADVEMEQVNE
jgi:hypothetical protein